MLLSTGLLLGYHNILCFNTDTVTFTNYFYKLLFYCIFHNISNFTKYMPYYCIIYCFTVYINKARNYVIKVAVFFTEVQQSPAHLLPGNLCCSRIPNTPYCHLPNPLHGDVSVPWPPRCQAGCQQQHSGFGWKRKSISLCFGFFFPNEAVNPPLLCSPVRRLPVPRVLPCCRREPQVRLIFTDKSSTWWSSYHQVEFYYIKPISGALRSICSHQRG